MVLLTIFLLAQAKAALGPVPRYEVKRAATPIVVDGRLDEAAWSKSKPIEFVFPWDQQTGAKQKTMARLLWDDDYLYVAYECEDTDIVALHQNRDDPTYKDDAVEIFINPDPTQTFYYGLEMNALATLYDYFYAFPKLLIARVNFEGVHLATNIRGTLNVTGDKDEGWSLEVAIPWKNFTELAKTLPPAPGSVWRANLNRWDGTEPNRRLSQWSNSGMPDPNPHNPERFGELVFVK
ncbi:MAG: carbohydrate-binding family 9-like protein [Acidobacteriaceae bacterium]|nr:carbohydrate-binding family 9-like protein [Acidobacteriaceae bacterium]